LPQPAHLKADVPGTIFVMAIGFPHDGHFDVVPPSFSIRAIIGGRRFLIHAMSSFTTGRQKSMVITPAKTKTSTKSSMKMLVDVDGAASANNQAVVANATQKSATTQPATLGERTGC
jgi:hypothetical protein